MYLLEPKLVNFYVSILEAAEYNMYLEKKGWLGSKPMPKAVVRKTIKTSTYFCWTMF